jgi:hypothetical protein
MLTSFSWIMKIVTLMPGIPTSSHPWRRPRHQTPPPVEDSSNSIASEAICTVLPTSLLNYCELAITNSFNTLLPLLVLWFSKHLDVDLVLLDLCAVDFIALCMRSELSLYIYWQIKKHFQKLLMMWSSSMLEWYWRMAKLLLSLGPVEVTGSVWLQCCWVSDPSSLTCIKDGRN